MTTQWLSGGPIMAAHAWLAAQAAATAPAGSRLLAMPAEIRNRFWQLVVEESEPIELEMRGNIIVANKRTKSPQALALSRVCRAMHQETTQMFYAVNTVIINTPDLFWPDVTYYPHPQVFYDFCHMIGGQNTKSLRKGTIDLGVVRRKKPSYCHCDWSFAERVDLAVHQMEMTTRQLQFESMAGSKCCVEVKLDFQFNRGGHPVAVIVADVGASLEANITYLRSEASTSVYGGTCLSVVIKRLEDWLFKIRDSKG